MFLCTVLQPFGRAVVEAAKAFFNMEQERSTFRGVLESHAGECLKLFMQPCVIFVILCFLMSFFTLLSLQSKRRP